MPDEPNATPDVPQGETPETPPVVTPAASANRETPEAQPDTAETPAAPLGPDGQPFDPDRAKATIDKLRTYEKQAKDLEKELAKYQKAEKEREREQMTELDKLRAELADIQTERETLSKQAQEAALRVQKQTIENAIIKQAGEFVDVNDVIMALEGKIEVDEDGKPVDVDKALAKLAKDKPHWVKKPRPNVSPTNPGNGATAGNTEEQLRNLVYGDRGRNYMTPEKAREHGGGVVGIASKE